MEPVKATASLFTGEPGCAWRDPVVLDLTSGEVRRLKPGARELTLEIANHVRVLAEAEALAPHIMLESRAAKPAGGAPAAQADHE